SANSCTHFWVVRWSSESWNSMSDVLLLASSTLAGSADNLPIGRLLLGNNTPRGQDPTRGTDRAPAHASPRAPGPAPGRGQEGVRGVRVPRRVHGDGGEGGGRHKADPLRPLPLEEGSVHRAHRRRPGRTPRRGAKALAAPTGNRERIRASFQAYFDFVDEHAEGFRLLMQEAVGAEEEFRQRVAQVRDQILAEVAHLIVRESRGRLDRGHSEIVALALIGMVETVAQREPGGPPERRREAVDLLVRLAWRGITELDQ